MRTPVFSSVVLCLLALGFGLLSLQESFNPYNEYLRLTGQESEAILRIHRPLVRDPVVNVAVGAAKELRRGVSQDTASYATVADSPPASLVPTGSEQRNIVVVFLESTRAQSVTPYVEGLATTPFMDELAKKSLLAERAYGSVPYL